MKVLHFFPVILTSYLLRISRNLRSNTYFERAQDEYEIVVADFGSICDSAAWYVGIQRSAIRTIVAHPDHTPRFKPLEDVVKHLDLALSDFF